MSSSLVPCSDGKKAETAPTAMQPRGRSRRRKGLSVAMIWLLELAGLLALGGCTSNPVGRIGDLGTALPAPSEVVVASPSLDCVSRTCLRVPLSRELPMGSMYPEGNNGLCSAECESDDDCDEVPESPCKTGFSCTVAVTVGPFCCRKLCQCKDYVHR